MKIFYAKSISFIVLICATLLSFFSCSNLNEPVREFFEYYTDSAAIVKMQMNDSYEVDASGRKCYGSDSDKSIDLYLRNPQRYDINFYYKYNLSGLESVIAAPSVPFTIIQNPIDKTMATLTFKKEFLEKIDNGDFTVEGTIQKNISGDITLTEKGTGRLFDSFHIDLSANTKPPRFRYSMFQRKGNIGDDETCYVLCFNIPKIDGTIHERDTRNLYIGKDHWTFSGNITTDADLTADASNRYKLTTVQPTPLRLLDDTDDTSFLNPEPTAYTSLYYIIDDKNPEDNTENIGYMLRIQDDEGLYNQVYVSIKALQLKEPLTVSENGSAVKNSDIVSADDNTGYYKLVLTHSKGTWQFDETYGKIDGQNLTAMPKICYTIYRNGIVFASGTQTAPVKINLPPSSTKYTVKAYAHENGYVDSDEIEVKDIKVTRSTNYYVNQNGHSKADGANGSPMLPYRNMAQCISDINADTDNDDGPFTIYMQTDLVAQDSDFDYGTKAYIIIPSGKKITIQGLNGVKTLNLNRTIEHEGYGIQLSYGELTLKDIKITGGVCNDSDGSGGIDYEIPAKLNISGTVILDGNYYNPSGELKTNNIYTRGGNTEVIKINVIGPIAGSKIGIHIPYSPTVAQSIQFTTGYNTYNAGIPPSKYFFSDDGYGISVNDDNEAVLAVNGGSMGDVISSQSMTFECAEYENAAAASKFIKFYPGFAKEITITPTIKLYGTAVNTDNTIWNSVSWTTWLTCDGTEITGTRRSSTGNAIKGVIPATGVYEENYMLNVKAILNGVSYDESWPVKGKKDISYMSAAPTTPGTYGIASGDGLIKLKEWVEAGLVASTGYVFELSSDITVSSGVGNIGTSERPFKAIFDGKGHKISGLSITGENGCCALFANTNSATIQNLTVQGSISLSANVKCAGLVASAINSNIINCVNKVNITNSYNYNDGIAGICHTSNGSIIDGCINEGNLQNSGYLAGILANASTGTPSSTVRNCINKGSITSTKSASSAGGIESTQQTYIYNCYNLGTITTSAGFAGGIVAKGSSSYTLSNCFSNAEISGTNKGNISGTNTFNSTTSVNNYFIVKSDSSAQEGAGNSTQQPYTYKCTNSGSATTIASDVTVGSYTGTDVVQLLNAWIASQSNPSLYKRWKYDAGGIPVFDE